MADWYVETGLGETRAIAVENDEIVETRIERHDSPLRIGDIRDARLATKLSARRGIVDLGDLEARLEPLPAGLTEGARTRVEVTRLPIPEAGRPRLARVRAVEAESDSRGPDLAAALAATGRVTPVSPTDSIFEDYGWSELLESAATGRILFGGGSLVISLTPAMTLIDVDGAAEPENLARAGLVAAAKAIRRFDIGGAIGVDLPTVRSKALRSDLAAMVDDILPEPFERTAVNGFGFIQIVRRRARLSLPEYVQGQPVASAALALLRRAERAGVAGALQLTAPDAVMAWIKARPALVETLARQQGGRIVLTADAALALSGGHVQPA